MVSIYGGVQQFRKLSFDQEPSLADALSQVQLTNKAVDQVWLRRGGSVSLIKAPDWPTKQIKDGDVIFVPWESFVKPANPMRLAAWVGGSHAFEQFAGQTVFDALIACVSNGFSIRKPQIVLHMNLTADPPAVTWIETATADADFRVPHTDERFGPTDTILVLPGPQAEGSSGWRQIQPDGYVGFGKKAPVTISPDTLPTSNSVVIVGDVDGYPNPYSTETAGILATLLAKCHGASADYAVVDEQGKQPVRVVKTGFDNFSVHPGATVFVPKNGNSGAETPARILVLHAGAQWDTVRAFSINSPKSLSAAIASANTGSEMAKPAKKFLFSNGNLTALTDAQLSMKPTAGDVVIVCEQSD